MSETETPKPAKMGRPKKAPENRFRPESIRFDPETHASLVRCAEAYGGKTRAVRLAVRLLEAAAEEGGVLAAIARELDEELDADAARVD